MDLEEELEHAAEVGLRRVVHDLERLRVAGVIAIGGMVVLAAGVPDAGGDHPRLLADQVLHPPEAPACQDRRLVVGHTSSLVNRVLYSPYPSASRSSRWMNRRAAELMQ